MKKQFPDVSGTYGAPMGRSENLSDLYDIVNVFQVRMVDGDYDDGGAYWGGGRDVDPVFCARGDDFEAFTRAKSHVEACREFRDRFPDLTIADEFDFEAMLYAYLTCALWSSTEWDENGRSHEPLDYNYCVDDFSELAVKQAREDCESFLQLCARENLDLSALSPIQVGHDFWLTRNHHGCGFFDRGLGELGDQLTDLAQTFGSCDPWVNEGKVELE